MLEIVSIYKNAKGKEVKLKAVINVIDELL